MDNFLTSHFPLAQNWKSEFLVGAGFGVFVAIFLNVFQPYGTSEFVSVHKQLFLAGYGVIFSSMFLTFSFLIGPLIRTLLRLRHWTIKLHFLMLCKLLLLTSFVWYLYWGWYFESPLSILGWLRFVVLSLSVTIFPVVALIAAAYIRWLKFQIDTKNKPRHQAAQTHEESNITLRSCDGTAEIELNPNQILYIRAARNYVEVFFLKQERACRCLLRGALKRISEQIPRDMLLQCHRSYLINPEYVVRVTKNKRRAQLHFDESIPKVPVSRAFRSLLSSLAKQEFQFVPERSR